MLTNLTELKAVANKFYFLVITIDYYTVVQSSDLDEFQTISIRSWLNLGFFSTEILRLVFVICTFVIRILGGVKSVIAIFFNS